jgi:hypothetical protein
VVAPGFDVRAGDGGGRGFVLGRHLDSPFAG